MSDVQTRGNEPAAAPAAAAVSPRMQDAGRPLPSASRDEGSFGRALAAAREARGMSQGDVAAQLRLHLRQVQAIEAEDLAALPEGPFVRGYVRNYARLVDLPAEPLLALLSARMKPTDPLPPVRRAGAVSPLHRPSREPITGRVVAAGAIAVLLLLAAVGWWTMRGVTGAPPTAAPAPVTGTVAPAPAPVQPQDAAPEAPPTSGAPAAQAEAPASAVAPDSAALKLTFRERSWVEVRQADGTVLTSQTNAAGTTREVEGRPPFTLVIGNASKVDVQLRGQPVDLSAAIGRDDIARLRLE